MLPLKHTRPDSIYSTILNFSVIDHSHIRAHSKNYVAGHVNPVYEDEGKEFLIFITAQLGSTTLTLLPSHPQHHQVNWRYAVKRYVLEVK